MPYRGRDASLFLFMITWSLWALLCGHIRPYSLEKKDECLELLNHFLYNMYYVPSSAAIGVQEMASYIIFQILLQAYIILYDCNKMGIGDRARKSDNLPSTLRYVRKELLVFYTIYCLLSIRLTQVVGNQNVCLL